MLTSALEQGAAGERVLVLFHSAAFAKQMAQRFYEMGLNDPEVSMTPKRGERFEFAGGGLVEFRTADPGVLQGSSMSFRDVKVHADHAIGHLLPARKQHELWQFLKSRGAR